jgi:hypothetical protein
VRGLIDDFGVTLLFLEDREDAEDGHDLLTVAMNVLLEVNQTILDCVLQGLL